jgi:hypothetical protein
MEGGCLGDFSGVGLFDKTEEDESGIYSILYKIFNYHLT